MDKKALIVLAKNAELGKVKSRLAKSIGDKAALDIYEKLLSYTLEITKELEVDKFIFYSNEIDINDSWSKNNFKQFIQFGNNIGARMQHAFKKVFDQGYKSVVVIGSDCPELSSQIISSAFSELEKKDVVIGPAIDGGYYLIGMNENHPEFFINKKWSTNTVASDTISDFKKLHLDYSILLKLTDLDTIEDVSYLIKKGNKNIKLFNLEHAE